SGINARPTWNPGFSDGLCRRCRMCRPEAAHAFSAVQRIRVSPKARDRVRGLRHTPYLNNETVLFRRPLPPV
ncbi:hypothetical protein, partial [Neisseria bacilliformis]|uniref:hypothetical protein n=1 Tax=Neisseria bacilliformis TaxID=267212 RepID=UPI003C716909